MTTNACQAPVVLPSNFDFPRLVLAGKPLRLMSVAYTLTVGGS